MSNICIKDIICFLRESKIPFSFSGDEQTTLTGFSSLSNYKPGTFTWVKEQRNVPNGLESDAITLAITSETVVGSFQNVIRTSESKRAFFSTIEKFNEDNNDWPPIGQYSYVGPNVEIGANVRIGHNCTLNGNISIGDDTVVGNNVTIVNRVRIGKGCDIHSGVVIGHDGFSYTEDDNHQKKMNKHFGGVTIGDNVYIGMNTVVERGAIDDTVIRNGVKIDCMCLIGHNCEIGENAALVAGTTVYGSVIIGDNAYLAGPLIRNQCYIGNNSFVGLGAVVTKDVAANDVVAGVPARVIRKNSDGNR